MRIANVYVQDKLAGQLQEAEGGKYIFTYNDGYENSPVSLTMPLDKRTYVFETFPPFFEGLLPEGNQLDSLLRREKIDKKDYFSQLTTVGADLVGDVTVRIAE